MVLVLENTNEYKTDYPTHGKGTRHFESTKARRLAERGGNMMEHVLARRGSLKQGGQCWKRKLRKEEKQKLNRISEQRGRNGRVRDFAYTERTRRNTKHIQDEHRHGLCNIARE